ncbi:MAG: 3-dehydroquinate synthase [Sphingomonadaceae bacterium]
MIDVPVALGARSYTVSIGAGLLAEAGQRARALVPGLARVPVVTDETVADLHLPALARSMAEAGIQVEPIVVPPGEAAKTFAWAERVTDALIAGQVSRSGLVVALGGGCVGDLAGFAAGITKRGVPFVQIPTTLLAMVDSSVGGKTAINTAAGKNLVGAFHQPAAVWADPELLGTLPNRELRAGYAEIVKYGLINDAAFFAWLETHGPALLARDPDRLVEAIATSVAAKAAIVAADEEERADIRALLNLGHTFGHALEAEAGFSDALLHGEAVAIGMAQAFRFSARQGLAPPAHAEQVARHLEAAGLPTAWPAPADRLIAHMLHDKKKTEGGLPFILARGIGQAFVAHGVPLAEVRAFLAEEEGLRLPGG